MTYRSDLFCATPKNDKDRIIKMHNSIDNIYIPHFERQELKDFAAKFEEAKQMLKEQIRLESYKYWRRKE